MPGQLSVLFSKFFKKKKFFTRMFGGKCMFMKTVEKSCLYPVGMLPLCCLVTTSSDLYNLTPAHHVQLG